MILAIVLVRVSTVEEISCPRRLLITETLNWGWLIAPRLSPLSSWQEAWQRTGQHGAGDRAQSSPSWSIGNRRTLGATLGVAWVQETAKPTPYGDTLPPTRPHPLWVMYSNRWVYVGQTYSNHHTYQHHNSWVYSETTDNSCYVLLL